VSRNGFSDGGQRAFRIAYDGAPFHGFQRQPDVPTVEDALFDALRELGVCGDEPTNYSAAGRTDAGVSAAAQTVAFDCPGWCDPAALNGALPESIRAWASADAVGFHATHDARQREYVYVLHTEGIDADRAREAAERLSGEHDFHNLTSDGSGTVRDLDVRIDGDGASLDVTVRAGGFPRQLVRRLVSLLRSVASGAAPLSKVGDVLGPDRIEGPEGVPPAPAYPLYLADVRYGLSFTVAPGAAADARERFERRRIEHAVRSRVAGAIAGEVADRG
jgi:tRNA pseudouridine38-40 synthase